MQQSLFKKLKLFSDEIKEITDNFTISYLENNLSKLDKKKALNLLKVLKQNLNFGLKNWLLNNYSTKFDKDEINPFNKNIINTKLHTALGTKCEICGEGRVFHIAHIIPRKLNGSDKIENLLRLCANCHALFDRLKLRKKQLNKINWKNKSIESVKYLQHLYKVKL